MVRPVRRLSNMTSTQTNPSCLPPTTSAPPRTAGPVFPVRGPPADTHRRASSRTLGCGRSLACDLRRRNEFPSPVLQLGNRRYVIPTIGLLHAVGH